MSQKKILVVDDEPDFLEMIRMRLEVNDYIVVTASSGEKALEKIEKENPDAVLLDIMLPGGMDGLEVLKRIRKQNKNLPVFMLTAYSSEEIFKQVKKFNAFGFILKTGDLQREVENITSALSLADKHKKR